MITIDASQGEGGGSILRIATGLAVALQEPIKLVNIRKKRKNPGLAEQHLNGLRLLAEISNSTTKGLKLRSQEIELNPGSINGGTYHVHVRTAGSVSLVLQPALVALIASSPHSPSSTTIHIHGGATYGMWAPTIDYFHHVFLNFLQHLGVDMSINVLRHGFYPKGGAEITFVHRSTPSSYTIDQTHFTPSHLFSLAVAHQGLQKRKVAERMNESLQRTLQSASLPKSVSSLPLTLNTNYVTASSYGAALTFWATDQKGLSLGACAIGQKGISSEQLGKDTISQSLEFLQNSNVGVDVHLADQLIPLALSSSSFRISVSSLSSHLTTNIAILEQVASISLDISFDEEKQVYYIES